MNEDPNNTAKVFPNNFYFSATNNDVHFKILIPALSAGAIIGKCGESINQIQKETNTKVKISKSNEFYPGTKERVCLIIGTVEGIIGMHNYIMNKIITKLDRNFSQNNQELKILNERQRQVKILVPNSTAGLIIGKSGTFIKDMKETTGAFVQISQKAREINLLERCIIVGGDIDHIKAAIKIIIVKISQDPQSKICPNISYVDMFNPVPSAFPTGSPYATVNILSQKKDACLSPQLFNYSIPAWNSVSFNANNSIQTSLSYGAKNNLLSPLYLHSQIPSNFTDYSSLSWKENQNDLRSILNQIGYPDCAINEIVSALQTLNKYGLLSNPRSLPSPCNSVNPRFSISNQWLLRNKLVERDKFYYRQRGTNSFYYCPYLNELPRNINVYSTRPPSNRMINPSDYGLVPMSVQTAPIQDLQFISLGPHKCEMEVPECALSPGYLTEIEHRFRVKIQLRNDCNIAGERGETTGSKRILLIVGNEGDINEAVTMIGELSKHGIDSQIATSHTGDSGNAERSDSN